MSAFKILCPQCQAPLRSGKLPRVGKQVPCPQCHTSFQITQDMIAPAGAGSIPGVLLDELLAGPTVEATSAVRPAPAMGILEPARTKRSVPVATIPAAVAPSPAVAGPARSRKPWTALAVGCVILFGSAFAVAYFGSRNNEGTPPPKDKDDPLILARRDPAAPKERDPLKDAADKRAETKDVDKAREGEKAKPPEKKEPLKLDPSSEDVKKEPAKAVVEEKKTIAKPEDPKKEAKPEKKVDLAVGPATPGLLGLEPERVNRAVLRGAGFLKTTQLPSGSWSKGGHGVGYAALGGLTLLECKFPPRDPSIQAAANFVRANTLKLDETYDLALAVLFLDRLGEARDKALIQGLALRLVAGQNDKGGWDYRCPLLSPQEMFQLITFLQKTQPKVALQLPRKDDPFQPPSDISVFQPLNQEPGKDPKQPANPLEQKDRKDQEAGKDQDKSGEQPAKKDSVQPEKEGMTPGAAALDAKKPEEKDEPKKAVVKAEEKKTDDPKADDKAKDPVRPGVAPKVLPKGAKAVARPDILPPGLRDIPAVVGKGKGAMRKSRDDNSNSQFALLALWAARRHGVPTERTLQFAGERYRASQNPDGGWGYHIGGGTTPPMTCVGVLGIAMGVGTAPEFPKVKPGVAEPGMAAKPVLDEPMVDRGLLRLSRAIGDASPAGHADAMQNLYLLWSVERVAMMYGLKTIGGKDWYGWGGQLLVKHQNGDGSWSGEHYPGRAPTIDTCFALLFLKRSNLADDLTRNFEHFLVIHDPGK